MVEETAVQSLHGLVAVCITFLILNPLFVGLRFISRFAVKEQRIGWDDVFVVLGLIVQVVQCSIAFVIRHYEVIGNPPASLPVAMAHLEPLLKTVYASEQLTYAGFTFPKLSILFLYLRIFEGSKWFRRGTWTIIAITTGCWIAFAFVAAFLCKPVSYYWDRTIPGGTCIDQNTFWRAIPPFNILTDICAIILPIPYIWRLEAGRAKKVGIIAIFLTGGIGIVACCIRWAVYFEWSILVIGPYNTGPLLSWAIIEGSIYLIAACLPTLRPVVKAIIPRSLQYRFRTLTTPRSPSRMIVVQPEGRRDRPKHFSRLPDSPSDQLNLVNDDVEKGAASESRVEGTSTRNDAFELNDLDQDDGIYRTVDITVSESKP